jgi:hypothetical protein
VNQRNCRKSIVQFYREAIRGEKKSKLKTPIPYPVTDFLVVTLKLIVLRKNESK